MSVVLATDNSAGQLAGVYSVSVCDADAVSPDTIQPNAVTQLLLCSELRGRIENPNHYFDNPTAQTDAELDLLMMTQGWRRYAIDSIINNRFPTIEHPFETSQSITGHVTRTLSKSPKHLKLWFFSPTTGALQTFELGDSSRFAINNLDFADGTSFNLQASTQKERTNFIQMHVDEDCFPRLKPLVLRERIPISERFVEQSEKLIKVNSIRNMQYLDEVVVIGRKKYNPLGLEPDRMLAEGDYWLKHSSAASILAQRLGMLAVGVGSDIQIGLHPRVEDGKVKVIPPIVVIDDFVDSVENFLNMPTESIKQVEFFRSNFEIPAMYGIIGTHDVLLVYTKPAYRRFGRSLSMQSISPLGYAKPVEFYSPQYPLEDKESYKFPDYRTTLYWNPALRVGPDGKALLRFYNSDSAKRYLVTVEGVSDDGRIISTTKTIGQ